jgi:hypothetical protein
MRESDTPARSWIELSTANKKRESVEAAPRLGGNAFDTKYRDARVGSLSADRAGWLPASAYLQLDRLS